MPFVQIIDYHTSNIEELERVGKEWEAASGGGKARRRVLGQDRDDPTRYVNIVFFDSYEEAMANSDDPVTQEFAGKMASLSDGDPTFVNLEVIEDTSY